jgi:putative transposase
MRRLKADLKRMTEEYKRGSAPSLVAPNHLQRQFDVQEPNRVWVTDITYIVTYEG